MIFFPFQLSIDFSKKIYLYQAGEFDVCWIKSKQAEKHEKKNILKKVGDKNLDNDSKKKDQSNRSHSKAT